MIRNSGGGPSRPHAARTGDGISVAVVGGGYWGSKHVRVLSSTRGVDHVTLVEVDPERRSALAQAFPSIDTTNDLDDVLPACDAVVVATRSGTHAELALRALRAGRSVLVEKPLATTLADAELLCLEASAHNVTLMVGHTFVFNPAVTELKRRIDAGELGTIKYMRSMRLNLGLYQPDVNVIWDLAPHDISIMNFLLDDVPSEVTAWAHRTSPSHVEDVASLRLEYRRSNVEASVHVSWLDPSKVREVTVIGTRKMAVYDDIKTEERLRIYDRSVAPNGSRLHEAPMSYRYGDIVSPFIRFDEPLALEDAEFVDAVRTGQRTRATGAEGYDVVAVLEAAQRSIELDCSVPITVERRPPRGHTSVDDVHLGARAQ